MNTQTLERIGTGEFVGEFLYHLYRVVSDYGYDNYGEYTGWASMTLAEQTTHNAYNTISFAYDDFARTMSDTITEESDMNTQTLENIGHGEFVGEFLYQLYREIACYGYDNYGEFDSSLMTEDQRTLRKAYNMVSVTFDGVARGFFQSRTSEFTWDED